ncbi:MAG: serine/threonine-protein kinase, partial [Polyangiales bacterium]
MGRRPADSTPTVNERSGRGEAPEPEPEPVASEPPPPPEARYALGEEIARGGMGRVVDATDTVLGRVVAFKEALSEDPEARRRFAREIRITARLEHPSIVPVHDAGTTAEGSPFYVMRKVSGRPLEDLVVEADSLAKRLALVPHVLAAAQAIAHAHERGVLHRDLKPSNILVGSLGETVVIDWGLAKVIDEPDEPDEPAVVPMISAGDSLR